jgi:hypothetical protein
MFGAPKEKVERSVVCATGSTASSLKEENNTFKYLRYANF